MVVRREFVLRASGLALTAVLGCGGCGLFRRDPPPRDHEWREIAAGRRPLGKVTIANSADGFVVIRTAYAGMMNDGVSLRAKRGGETAAQLAVSPERRQGYISADIVSGVAEVDDEVYFPPAAGARSRNAPDTPSESLAPPTPGTPPPPPLPHPLAPAAPALPSGSGTSSPAELK